MKLKDTSGTPLLLIHGISIIYCILFLTSCSYHYVALGASDTLGVGARAPEDAYPHHIVQYLNHECRTTSLSITGKSGATIDDIVEDQIDDALKQDPDIVSIWIGANDIVKGISALYFKDNLEEALLELRNSRTKHIFIATIPPLYELPRFKKKKDADVTKDRVDEFNQIIHKLTAHEKIHLVDLSEIELSDTLISKDGFHPSSSGYQRIAEAFLIVMSTVLCSSPSLDQIPVS